MKFHASANRKHPAGCDSLLIGIPAIFVAEPGEGWGAALMQARFLVNELLEHGPHLFWDCPFQGRYSTRGIQRPLGWFARPVFTRRQPVVASDEPGRRLLSIIDRHRHGLSDNGCVGVE